MNINESQHILSRLRRRSGACAAAPAAPLALARDLGVGRAFAGPSFTLGAWEGKGAGDMPLPVAALHELQGAEVDDRASVAAFALLMAQRAMAGMDEKGGAILWIFERRQARAQGWLYPPGLAALGIDPARLLLAAARDSEEAMRVAADGLRSGAVAAVILSLPGARPKGLGLTSTRRFSLFARESGRPMLLLRDRPCSVPSAAWTRWQIAAAPSRPLAANAPGTPVFQAELLRHRGGREGLSALLEWSHERQEFAAHIGAVSPLPLGRAGSAPTESAPAEGALRRYA